jgi:hypothetical protein
VRGYLGRGLPGLAAAVGREHLVEQGGQPPAALKPSATLSQFTTFHHASM